MVRQRGQARLPLVLMVAGAGFLVWALIRVLGGGDGGGEGEARALEQRCAFPACRAADNELPARGYEGQSIVADPDDPNHLVVTDANMISGACSFHVTFDRGKEWADGIFPVPPGYTGCRINGPSGGHVPMGNVVRGPSGSLYVTFGSAHTDDARRESVLVGSSTDGGRSWQVTVAARPPSSLEVGYGRPLVTAARGPSGADSVLVTFWECVAAQNVCPRAQLSRSDDGGRTFRPPALVNDPSQNPSQAVVTPEGTVHVLYQIRYRDGMVDLVHATSTDGGLTFEDSLVDSQFGIGGTRGYDPAKLALDPRSGTLYAVYTDSRAGRQAVFFRRSAADRRSWTDPVPISSDQGATPTRNPWLSVGPEGRIDVAFYRVVEERREEVVWAFSNDGGATFATRLVTDQAINRSFGYVNEIGNWYPPGVSSTVDAAVVAWSDTRNADDLTQTVDVYVRRMVPGGRGLGLPP